MRKKKWSIYMSFIISKLNLSTEGNIRHQTDLPYECNYLSAIYKRPTKKVRTNMICLNTHYQMVLINLTSLNNTVIGRKSFSYTDAYVSIYK